MIKKSILNSFPVGTVKKITPISQGLIHQTYQIKSAKGIFILQRLHPVLAKQEIAKDFKAVTEFLAKQNFPAPRVMLSKRDEVLVKDGKYRWRMQTFIPGKTFDRVEKVVQAKEAGKIYARFHTTMRDFSYEFKSRKILHHTEKIYEDFMKTTRAHRCSPLMVEVTKEVGLIMKQLPKLFLPKNLPLRVIHGDPKVSNIIFTKARKAKAIIDLDTCNRRPLLVELGDAFRSWCGGLEDDPKNKFRLSVFKAAWQGYYGEAKDFITKREAQLVPKAVGTITLELATRFLKDYFEDKYFGWDEKRYSSRREHNLARARGQIALYQDLKKKMNAIKEIVRQ